MNQWSLLSSELGELRPGRYAVFQWPPHHPPAALTVAVLDSPSDRHADDDALAPFAAILVPRGQEHEWIFSTEAGCWELLSSARASRLVVLTRVAATSCRNQDLHRQSRTFEENFKTDDDEDKGFAGNLALEEDEDEVVKRELAPLMIGLFPARSFTNEPPPPDPFVSYEDNVVNRVIVEKAYSPLTGNILVEDVELLEQVSTDAKGQDNHHRHSTKLRRRMRFQRMPNLIQTEVPIVIFKKGQPVFDTGLGAIRDGEELEVRQDHTELVHKYLPPIVAGLVLASPGLEACVAAGKKVRVLSIGIGGGALPIFLHRKLGFHVVAVDLDETVLGLARCHFGLIENEHLQIEVGDGLEVVACIAKQAIRSNLVGAELQGEWQRLTKDSQEPWLKCSREQCHLIKDIDFRMNVIVVDVDAGDARLGLSSPPPDFLLKSFLLAVRIALQDGGMLAMNIMPRGTRPYKLAVSALREVFGGLYEIQVGDAENHVVFAFPTEIGKIDLDCGMALQVMQVIDERLIQQITEVDK